MASIGFEPLTHQKYLFHTYHTHAPSNSSKTTRERGGLSHSDPKYSIFSDFGIQTLDPPKVSIS